MSNLVAPLPPYQAERAGIFTIRVPQGKEIYVTAEGSLEVLRLTWENGAPVLEIYRDVEMMTSEGYADLRHDFQMDEPCCISADPRCPDCNGRGYIPGDMVPWGSTYIAMPHEICDCTVNKSYGDDLVRAIEQKGQA